MADISHGDFENGSVLDLPKVGAYRVAEDAETRIWMLSWRLDDGPVHRWHPGEPDPTPLLDHVARGGRFVGHNVSYERLLWNVAMRNRSEYRHWPELRIEQCCDTMARALSIHLPADLDTLGQVLGLRHLKDKTARSLMLKMARPRKIYGADDVTQAVRDMIAAAPAEWTHRANGGVVRWWNTPENIARLGDYCDDDVRCESEADARLPPLSPEERALWELDQRINDRGAALDMTTIERLADVRRVAIRRADEEIARFTEGRIDKHTQDRRIVKWLVERGVPCTSLAKEELPKVRAAADCLGDDAAVAVLDLRKQAAKSSTAKLETMLDVGGADGRARGIIMFHRALTGRFGGAKIQGQNLPRVDEDTELPLVLQALGVVRTHNDPDPASLYEALDRLGMPVMTLLSKMLRSMFVAGGRGVLVGADFSGIEARVNAWLAGEKWELDAFRAYDAGIGPDTYKLSAASILNIPIEVVSKLQRQLIGKPAVLSGGYQGAVGAILRFIRNVDVVAGAVADAARGTDKWRKAEEQHDRLRFHNGLPREQWVALKTVVNGWREAHPAITQSWWDRQDAVLEAVDNPGRKVTVMGGKVSYLVADGFLWARLPSGKLLGYSSPRIIEKKDDWLVDEDGEAVAAGEMAEDEIAMRVAAGATLHEGQRRTQVCYQGKNKNGKWGRQYLYGGVLANNDCQGTARELLRFAMMNIEKAGYPITMHVHDEIVSEVAQEMADERHYESLMSILPPWLAGLPLAAKAWSSERYIK